MAATELLIDENGERISKTNDEIILTILSKMIKISNVENVPEHGFYIKLDSYDRCHTIMMEMAKLGAEISFHNNMKNNILHFYV